MSVRLDIQSDGTAVLTVKMTSGSGGSNAGHLIENRTRRLTREQVRAFVDRVSSSEFWRLPTLENPPIGGPDGSQWIIEGVKNGKYHVVDRWTPKSGAIRTLGLALAIDLGQVNIPSEEIY
jgi:hypothetical protein